MRDLLADHRPRTARFSPRPAARVVEARVLNARRTLRSALVAALLNPLLYLLAMGLGIGAVVDPAAAAMLPGGSYLAFLGPGLLVATAMQISATESLWPVMVGLEWNRTYEGAVATPLRPIDLVLGHIGFVFIRVLFAASVIGAAILLTATAPAAGVAAAVLVTVLVAWAFAAPVMAFTATLRSHAALTALFRFAIVPLFLFSGTFFPIDRLPPPFATVAPVSPLWHGVELARFAAFDNPTGWPVAAHLLVLLAWGTAGVVLAERQMRKVLAR